MKRPPFGSGSRSGSRSGFRADRPVRQNLAGINFERSERASHRPGFWGRMVSIVLTLAGILIVVWLLFNPIRIRPAVGRYVEAYNRIAAAQSLPDRLETAAGAAENESVYRLTASGLLLTVRNDANGNLTALKLSDDPTVPPADGWLKLTPAAWRDRVFVMLEALDSKWTVVSLYQAFQAMGLDLDQPIAAQPAGSREHTTAGLQLLLKHDNSHFSFEARLDILKE